MKLWKRAAAGAAAAVALALAPAAGVGANDASRAQDPNWCDYGSVCFWNAPDYDGERSDRDNPGPGCDLAPDDEIWSMRNWSGRPIRVYADDECDDLIKVVPHGENLRYIPGALSWR